MARDYWQTKCARTKRNAFILEGKQLSPVFLLQIRGCPGEVKASNSFLSWHFCVGAIHSWEACTKIWILPPVLNTSTRVCSNTEVLRKELLLVCACPEQHLLHHQQWGEVLSLANKSILIFFLELTSKTGGIWIPSPKLCMSRDLFQRKPSRIGSSYWFTPP